MIPHTVFPGWEFPYIILPTIFVFLYMYTDNRVRNTKCSKYGTLHIILSCLLFSALHMKFTGFRL
jgi:hypothetical protein